MQDLVDRQIELGDPDLKANCNQISIFCDFSECITKRMRYLSEELINYDTTVLSASLTTFNSIELFKFSK